MAWRLRSNRSRLARRTRASSVDRSGIRLSGAGANATGIAGPDSSRRSSRTSGPSGIRGVAQRTHGRCPLTTSAAIDTAFLLSGAIVIETVFQWHGMGALFVTALRDIDVYLLTGWLLVTGAVIIVFNLIADLLYGILDPRIRVG